MQKTLLFEGKKQNFSRKITKMFNPKKLKKMKTSEDVPDVFQEKEITVTSLTDEERQELHIEDELKEMEMFFSKEFDEMDLRFQDYETIY